MVPLALPDPVRESLHARSVRNRQRCAICMDPPHTQTPGGTQSLAAIDANLDRVLLRGIGPGLDGDGALSPGRHCHSTRPSAAIGCHPLGLHRIILRPLLTFAVRVKASPRARHARAQRRGGAGGHWARRPARPLQAAATAQRALPPHARPPCTHPPAELAPLATWVADSFVHDPGYFLSDSLYSLLQGRAQMTPRPAARLLGAGYIVEQNTALCTPKV